MTLKRKGVLRQAGRMLRLRPASEAVFDRVRLAVALRSDPVYQPLTWIGRGNADAERAQGVETRWRVMLPVIEELGVRNGLDIGCNVGWYVFELASRGIPALGVESHPPYYRTAMLALQQNEIQEAGILVMNVTPNNTSLLLDSDCVILLAVWHHLVRAYGLDAATDILEKVWRKTHKVLFFETGEDEMGPEYGLPAFEPDPRTWLIDYLGRHCEGATVRHLGQHHGGSGDDVVAYRNLFAVVRSA